MQMSRRGEKRRAREMREAAVVNKTNQVTRINPREKTSMAESVCEDRLFFIKTLKTDLQKVKKTQSRKETSLLRCSAKNSELQRATSLFQNRMLTYVKLLWFQRV